MRIITIVIFTLFATMTSVLAQHGDVGRDGGSRIAHEHKQSEALTKNNDPRFVPYKSLIDRRLKKSVRQVVEDYDRALHNKIKVSPEQFLAIQLVAIENHVDSKPLLKSVGSINSGDGGDGTPTPTNGFIEQLATSLQNLAGMNVDLARDIAGKAELAVSDAKKPTN